MEKSPRAAKLSWAKSAETAASLSATLPTILGGSAARVAQCGPSTFLGLAPKQPRYDGAEQLAGGALTVISRARHHERLFFPRSRRSIARCLRLASLDDNALPCSSMAIRDSPPKKRLRIQARALRIMRSDLSAIYH
jgi:hypothetical protein